MKIPIPQSRILCPQPKNLNSSTKQTSADIIASEELLSDEPQLESSLHLEQIITLLQCLEWWWQGRTDFFASGNISIYYDKQHIYKKRRRLRGPDFFVVLDTHPEPRNSWAVWEEDNRFPNLIVELLSDETEKTDKTKKKVLYQETFKTPEYFWFHPFTLEFAGFRLVDGKYQTIAANAQGWMWSEQLGLFLGVHHRQLHYFTPQGKVIITALEQLKLERQQRELFLQQAAVERRERELAQQRIADMEALLARYRERFDELPD